MVVVCHQAVGVTKPIEPIHHFCEYQKKSLTILVILKNRLTPVTS
jgi:hypothetical protein